MRYAGVDECGNGCLAGPVVAVAVAMGVGVSERELRHWRPIREVRDSKKTTPLQRAQILPELLAYLIDQHASIGIGDVPAAVINERGHSYALDLAKRTAVLSVLQDWKVNLLIVDGAIGLQVPVPQIVVPRADSTYWLVSAASIIAKCYRDAYMHEIAKKHPVYDWDKNLGYTGGSRQVSTHVAALRRYGLTEYHRIKACRTVLS